MTSVTTVAIHKGKDGCVASVTSTIKRDDYASLHYKGLSSGARARMERFYDEIDRHLAAWEREMFPKKKRRRRRGNKRHGRIIDLLGGKEVRHA